MVLDVPRSLHARGVQVALEFPEKLLVALSHDVYEHIETPTVGHAHDSVAMAEIGGIAEQGVQ